jgi:hypothetical protein
MPSPSKCSVREQNAYVPELAGVEELAGNKGFTEYTKKTQSDQTNHGGRCSNVFMLREPLNWRFLLSIKVNLGSCELVRHRCSSSEH